jgi:hypothetical protein
VVPSEQLRLQPTSLGYDPLEQAIVEDVDVGSGEGDDDGGLGDGGEACGQTDFPGPIMPLGSAMQAPMSANQRQEAPLAFVFAVQTSQEALAASHSLDSRCDDS